MGNINKATQKNPGTFLFHCGSCKYKKKGRCTNWLSDCNKGIVDDACSCDEWMPRKDILNEQYKNKDI